MPLLSALIGTCVKLFFYGHFLHCALYTYLSRLTKMKNVLFTVRNYVLFKSVGKLVGVRIRTWEVHPGPKSG